MEASQAGGLRSSDDSMKGWLKSVNAGTIQRRDAEERGEGVEGAWLCARALYAFVLANRARRDLRSEVLRQPPLVQDAYPLKRISVEPRRLRGVVY